MAKRLHGTPYEIKSVGKTEAYRLERKCENDNVALSWGQSALSRAEVAEGEYLLSFMGAGKTEPLYRFHLIARVLTWAPA